MITKRWTIEFVGLHSGQASRLDFARFRRRSVTER